MWYNKLDLYIYGSNVQDFNNSINTSNMINGKPVYYIFKDSNRTYDGFDTNYLHIIDGYNVTIENINMDHGSIIQLTYSSNSAIENCSLNNSYAIWLMETDESYIRYNVVTNSLAGNLIYYGSDSNYITNWSAPPIVDR